MKYFGQAQMYVMDNLINEALVTQPVLKKIISHKA